ncbi:Perforin-1 [Bagarius yarrelli]|uniref:Perforin-1 n=1 Tax=Bagarius yarrelli TaxID=175774 RepID=A0A556UZP3_BAGYA|nr:Perforin-1 [Bagarius yarrelli]
MLQTLLIWAVFATSLLSPTSQHCFRANSSQCRSADFPPGADLAGEGFDITTMQRKGAYVLDMSSWLKSDGSCTLCNNPYMKNQKQRLPVSVVDWRSIRKCRMKLSSTIYKSSESLIEATTSSIENNWANELNIMTTKGPGSLMLAGSKSKLAKYSMEKTKNDKYSFTSHSMSCGYYRYRVSNSPLLHSELKREIRKLPKTYNQHRYFKLINKFGTHYITKVTLGGKINSVTSIKECQVTLQGLTVDEIKMCLDVEASGSRQMSSSFKVKAHACKSYMSKLMRNRDFTNSFSDRDTTVIGGYTQSSDLLFSSKNDPKAYNEWLASLPAHPDVMSYMLESIHNLLPKTNPARKHLRKAIKDYILKRGLLKKCTSRCTIGTKINPSKSCQCSCLNNPQLTDDCCPKKRGSAEVTVTVIKGQGLWGDWITATDGYVVLYLDGIFRGQTSTINNNNNPYWGKRFYLGAEDITHARLKLEVFDEDHFSKDFLGTCNIRLNSGKTERICTLKHGLVFYKVEVKCIPGLTGTYCKRYKPSPMDAELAKVYVSRNALPIPKDMLLEMGVHLDVPIAQFNKSSTPKAAGFEL